jgi:hypothetical protein
MYRNHRGQPARFAQVSQEFTRDPRVNPFARSVFICIAGYVGPNGPAFPSYPTIMANTGIASRTTIANAIKDLVALGYLFPKKRGRSVDYYLVPEFCRPGFVDEPVHKMDRSPTEDAHESVHGMDHTSTRDVPISVHGMDSSKTHLKKTQLKRGDLTLALPVADGGKAGKGRRDFRKLLGGLKSLPK